jgi:UDP-glucose 4-epimerase
VSRCVVTGGAGFIGSHLVEHLVGAGHEVVVLDDFSNGRPENLARVAGRITLKTLDVAESNALAQEFLPGDRIFHLAALADIVPSIERPLAYHRANVEGTVAVLEAARQAGAARVVYAASSSRYGIPDTYPTPETAPARPQYPYALTKDVGERYALHWGAVYGLPVVSLRLFNVYGPRSRTSGTYGAVFGVFLAQKLAGRPFTVVGDGTQTRDFTFVSDVAAAFTAAAFADVAGEAINIGSGGTYSVNRIVDLLGAEHGVEYVPPRPGEPACTFADIGKAQALLGWEPQVGLDAGVARLLEEIESWRDAPVWDAAAIERATATWFRYLSST